MQNYIVDFTKQVLKIMLKNNQTVDSILIKAKKIVNEGNNELAQEFLNKIKQKYPNNLRIKNEISRLNKINDNFNASTYFKNLLS